MSTFSACLVSHGSSTVPQYIVEEINALGGSIHGAAGVPLQELQQAIPCGIGKINVDTDIRLAITRNIREFFVRHPEKQGSTSIAAIWALMEQNPSEFDPRAYLVPVMEPLITGAKITDPRFALIVVCIKRGSQRSRRHADRFLRLWSAMRPKSPASALKKWPSGIAAKGSNLIRRDTYGTDEADSFGRAGTH